MTQASKVKVIDGSISNTYEDLIRAKSRALKGGKKKVKARKTLLNLPLAIPVMISQINSGVLVLVSSLMHSLCPRKEAISNGQVIN